MSLKFGSAKFVKAGKVSPFIIPPPEWAAAKVADGLLPAGLSPPKVFQDLITKFNMSNVLEGIAHSADRFVARAANRELELFTKSGSIRWRRLDAPEVPEAGSAELPTPEHAMELADENLKRLGLYDDRAKIVAVDRTEIVTGLPGEPEPPPVVTEVHVNYRFSLDGLPVVGPGAKIQVSFGARGDLIRVLKFWRPLALQPVGLTRGEERKRSLRLRIRKKGDLESMLLRSPGFARLSKKVHIGVNEAFFGYYAAPPSVPQTSLVPVYVCTGTVEHPEIPSYEFIRYIPAVRITDDDWKLVGPQVKKLVGA